MRSSTVIQADLDAAYEARTALVSGGRVTEVQRGLDRRLIRYASMSLKDLNDVIVRLERELEQALAVEATAVGETTRARRPIGLRWAK